MAIVKIAQNSFLRKKRDRFNHPYLNNKQQTGLHPGVDATPECKATNPIVMKSLGLVRLLYLSLTPKYFVGIVSFLPATILFYRFDHRQ
jgi:hypothetical protein